MGADRNAALHQKVHGLGGPAAAFELDHVGAGLHQDGRAADRLFLGLVVAAKGQVGNHPGRGLGSVEATRHRFGVVTHGFQAYAHGAGQTLADHAERVANQNTFHACGIGHGGKGGVVGGEHGDFFTAGSHLLQARQAHGPAAGHGRGRWQGAVGRGMQGGYLV